MWSAHAFLLDHWSRARSRIRQHEHTHNKYSITRPRARARALMRQRGRDFSRVKQARERAPAISHTFRLLFRAVCRDGGPSIIYMCASREMCARVARENVQRTASFTPRQAIAATVRSTRLLLSSRAVRTAHTRERESYGIVLRIRMHIWYICAQMQT